MLGTPQGHSAHPLLAGLPHERETRIAARRSFVEIKQQFIDAVAGLGGPRGDWLRHQVRQSRDPSDLWQLRATVMVAMGNQSPLARADLQRALDAMFPGEGGRTGALPAPLPAGPLLL